MDISKIRVLAGLLLLAIAMPGFAQMSNIDLDKNVIYGTLDNGMRYYIRENAKPEQRAQFWLTVNAGAILEEDHQDGLAHFCEHMAFNGTKNFKKHEIINYLQRIGMKFGPEINAYTVFDQTNYMLQKVPIDTKENIDTSLMILYDWACNVSYESTEIDNERGVIHEEWRTRRNAGFRMRNQYEPVLFANSKYAERDIIGSLDVIDNCEYSAMRDFYNEWYRPDLQAIIAVGDFDAKVIEAKIKKKFSKIPKRKNAKPRKEYPVPGHKETYVNISTDKEASNTRVTVYYKHNVKKQQGVEEYEEGLKGQLYTSMLNNRLYEQALETSAPFISAFSVHTNLRRTVDAYISMATAKNNQVEASLESILKENKRVKEFGFTASELERAKKEYLSSLESVYKEKDQRESSSYAREYQMHFLMNSPSPGIEWEYQFDKQFINKVTLDEVNALAKKWITDENRVVVITGPEGAEYKYPNEKQVLDLMKKVEHAKVEAYADKVADVPLFTEKVTPGKLSSTEIDKVSGIEHLVLSNGINIYLKKTDFKEDEILMSAYSLGGASKCNVDDDISADFCTSVVGYGGIASFDQLQLQKMLADKNLRLSPWIGDLQEGFNGSTSPEDLETFLQLQHLYFTQPRIDKTAYESLMTRYGAYLANTMNDPNQNFRNEIQTTLYSNHKRERPMTSELLQEADFATIKKIYEQRFADPASFTFFFVGNINKQKALPLFEKYLGSLSAKNNKESWSDMDIDYPKKKVEKEVPAKLEIPKSTIYTCYHGTFDYSLKNRLLLDAIVSVLDTRYTETIREEEGGSYSISVRKSTSQFPDETFRMEINFDCDPERVDIFKGIVHQEIKKLIKEGPSAKNLDEFKKNKTKEHLENVEINRYWLAVMKSNHFNKESYIPQKDYLNMIESISAKDVQKTAAKLLDNDRVVELVMTPEK